MNWILALVAFAGLMAILSTVVTVTVEAVHKAFSMRKTGLQEMLRALHDNVVRELEAGNRPNRDVLKNNGRSKEAADFASAMTKSPSFGGGGRWWWPSNWGLNIFQRRFERLTKRQFAEQLAQTDFGSKLSGRDRATIRRVLAHTSYEFDRYGVAQSQFFRRRAKVISGLVAFSFVSLANVNAIDLYMHLATDEAALGRTMRLIEGNNLQAMADRAEAVQARLDGQVERLADEAEALASATDGVNAEAQLEALRAARQEVATTISQIGAYTGLPMGRRYFPYCEDVLADPEQCSNFDGAEWQVMFTTWTVPEPVVRLGHSPGDAIVWVLSLIATAGLLGLGAPFWFDLFNRTAAMAGGQMLRRAQAEPSAAVRAATAVRQGKRGTEDPEIEEMTDAFLVASGIVDAPYPVALPLGMRLGEASKETTDGGASDLKTSAASTGDPPSGIRRVPGWWGGGSRG